MSRLCLLLSLVALACDARPSAEGTSDSSAAPKAESAAVVGPQTLTADGWGDLRIGMTRDQVVAAAGEDANPNAVGGPDPESCDQFRPARAPEGLLVMVEKGILTRISVSRDSKLVTDRGFGLGAGASEIASSYGDKAKTSPHKYMDAPAAYITVWTVAPPAADARGIVYEIGRDGRVAHIHAGGESITYVEGCL